jgi:hypothetical protein
MSPDSSLPSQTGQKLSKTGHKFNNIYFMQKITKLVNNLTLNPPKSVIIGLCIAEAEVKTE